VIGWLLRSWQRRYPGPVLALTLALLVAGIALLGWWVLRDLARGSLLRPMLGVAVLAALSIRVIMSFRPYRRR
jgi:hypothetical protein